MNIAADNSGILAVSATESWPRGRHDGSERAKQSNSSLSETLGDLIRNAETDQAIRDVCLRVISHHGLTAWSEDRSILKFWSNGVDATLRWDVSTNPIDRRDPPICVLSIKLGDGRDGLVFYATVLADMSDCGMAIVWQAVRSIVFQATEVHD